MTLLGLPRRRVMDKLEKFLGIDQALPSPCRSTQLMLLGKPKILVVDDNEDNLLLLTCALEQLKCSLLTAIDGQTTLSLAQIYQPNLILLDILLPDLDGLEVLSQLRQNPKTQEIPVIAVTALARAEDKRRILLAGFNDYISKPYMLDEVEAIVKRHLSLTTPIS